jgi:hypothetical protein
MLSQNGMLLNYSPDFSSKIVHTISMQGGIFYFATHNTPKYDDGSALSLTVVK